MAATIDNAAIVREVYKVFNGSKSVDELASLVQPDAQMTLVPFGAVVNYRDDFKSWATAFPDARVDISSIVAQGDKVIAEFIGRGTHTGVFNTPGGPIPPSNKRAELRFVQSYELRGGKIISGRMYFDSASFLAQLGLAQQLPQIAGKAAQAQQRH